MPTDPTSTDYVSQSLDILGKFAAPFANTLAYGQDRASEIALASERARINAINGSGTSAPTLSTTLREWLFGAPAANGRPATSGAFLPMLIVVVIGIVALYFVRHR